MTALALRNVAALILWGCASLWTTAAWTPRSARLALDTGLLVHREAPHWFAAWDWGVSTRLLDPAWEQRQQSTHDCGPASLRHLLAVRPSDSAPWPRIETRRTGCTLATLQRAARWVTDARIVRFDDPCTLHLPALLHLRRRHFIVLEEWRPDAARLFDPGHGVLLTPPRSVLRQLTGVALEIPAQWGPAARRQEGS